MSDAGERPGGEPTGTVPRRDDLEALDDLKAERIFLAAALRHAPGMQAAADACRADLLAAGASEDEVKQALLLLARNAVFPPERKE